MQHSSGPSYLTSTLGSHQTDEQEDDQQPAEELCCTHGGRSRVKLVLPVLISGLLLLTVVITGHVIAHETGYYEKTCQTADGLPNPTASSTDYQPRCVSVWKQYGRKCYYFSKHRLNWNESQEECVRRRSHLALITNRDEQRFLMKEIQPNMQHDNDKFWIGLTDRLKEGEWRWVDNSKLNTSQQFWGNQQPNDWKGKEKEHPEGEDCARMGQLDLDDKNATGWFDAFCHIKMKFICETQISS